MIGWSEELELGDEVIDTQHKMLIQTLEDTYEACSRGEGLKQLEETMKSILEHVDIHFKDEEAIQRRYNYPHYEIHKKIHDNYRREISEIIKKKTENGYTIKDLAQVISYLTRMIIQHIQEEDADIGRHIRGEETRVNYSVGNLRITDKLTGVMDEVSLYKRINETLEQNKEKEFIYVGINIYNFSQVNYTYGFDIGDQVLMYMAGYLQIHCNDTIGIGRVYGDRFDLLIEKTKDLSEIKKDLIYVKQKIEEGFRRKDAVIPLKLCMGVACYPQDGVDFKELRRAGNIALSESKTAPDHPLVSFEETMRAKIVRKSEIIKLIQPYNLDKHLRVVYQPICHADTGHIKGCEALLRLTDGEGNAISPEEFIPLAESNQLMNDLTYFCIKEVGRLLSEVPKEKLGYVSVNLSPYQFSDYRFINYIKQLTKSSKLDTRRMSFEITESTVVENFEEVTRCLKELRVMGSEIMIDDFGSAYSALSYLSRMEVDTIKIDKSFLEDIRNNKKAQVVLRGIIALAHEIDLTVIVEGVETKEEWELLKEMKVDRLQGFLFSRPLEKNDLIAKLFE